MKKDKLKGEIRRYLLQMMELCSYEKDNTGKKERIIEKTAEYIFDTAVECLKRVDGN